MAVKTVEIVLRHFRQRYPLEKASLKTMEIVFAPFPPGISAGESVSENNGSSFRTISARDIRWRKRPSKQRKQFPVIVQLFSDDFVQHPHSQKLYWGFVVCQDQISGFP